MKSKIGAPEVDCYVVKNRRIIVTGRCLRSGWLNHSNASKVKYYCASIWKAEAKFSTTASSRKMSTIRCDVYRPWK